MNPISDSAPTADEALQRLKAGNERFIAGRSYWLQDTVNARHHPSPNPPHSINPQISDAI